MFNQGNTNRIISGIVNDVIFTNIKIPPNKRIILKNSNWIFSGFYPCFSKTDLPSELAIKHNIPLHVFHNKIVGLILPYNHGFENEPGMSMTGHLKYLHLFNQGNSKKIVSGNIDGVVFRNIEIPANKRLIFRNSNDI